MLMLTLNATHLKFTPGDQTAAHSTTKFARAANFKSTIAGEDSVAIVKNDWSDLFPKIEGVGMNYAQPTKMSFGNGFQKTEEEQPLIKMEEIGRIIL